MAAEKIARFYIFHGRLRARRIHGPTLYLPELSHNDRDIYTFDTIAKIPFMYHFSFIDEKKHVWTFDMRFLLQLLQYGNQLKNPFSQELIHENVILRLQELSQILIKRKVAIVYIDTDVLTPEQIWNQKVLQVFLKFNSLGYGVNILWYENMNIEDHYIFYENLYELWKHSLQLTNEDRERIIPGHRSGRAPLFRWNPEDIKNKIHELKWWRKQNLALINTFLTRSSDRATQGCGALYILTAFAQTLPKVSETYPWLLAQ